MWIASKAARPAELQDHVERINDADMAVPQQRPRLCGERAALRQVAGEQRKAITLASSAGLVLEPIDQLGRVSLGQLGRQVLTRLSGERLEVTALRAGKWLVTGDPVVGVFSGDPIDVLAR